MRAVGQKGFRSFVEITIGLNVLINNLDGERLMFDNLACKLEVGQLYVTVNINKDVTTQQFIECYAL